jgi:thiol-disulfide isomerase/thioredoxin
MGKRTEIRRKRDAQQRNVAIAVIGGIALILLAVVLFVTLPKEAPVAAGNPASGQEEYTSIPAEVNYAAPELALENIQGGEESLLDYRDKVVLVNNWATWCPPCKAEMPTLVDFYNEHADEGLMIIAIEAGEPKDLVQQFVDQYQMPFVVWLDPEGKASMAFKNNSLPNSYVIDRSGTIRLSWTGQINREMLEKYVTPLLTE